MAEIKPFTGVDDRVRLADVVPLNTPFTLNIFPSEVCNFRCIYCAHSLGKDELYKSYGLNNRKMTTETIGLLCEQSKMFPNKYKLVSFMGHGEPLCNKKLPLFVKMVKDADISRRTDIITNCSLLTREMSDALIESGLDVLRVSLQGITDESYHKTCNTDIPFEKIRSQIEYFYKRSSGKCKVYVKIMDVSLEEGQEEEFYKLFANISDRMFIDKVKPVYDKVYYTEKQCDISIDRYGRPHNQRIVCPQPFYMLSVWPDGEVAPCDALYKASSLGNIHNTSITKLWNNVQHVSFCNSQLKGGRFHDPCCKRCCAPDDVAHEEDVLDNDREDLLIKLKQIQFQT